MAEIDEELEELKEKYAAYLPGIRQRHAAELAEREARRERGKTTAVSIAQYLYDTYHVQAVYLFGSTIGDGFYDHHSDIDLAVQGLAPADFYRAFVEALDLAAPFKLDLLDLDNEAMPAKVRHTILEEGHRL